MDDKAWEVGARDRCPGQPAHYHSGRERLPLLDSRFSDRLSSLPGSRPSQRPGGRFRGPLASSRNGRDTSWPKLRTWRGRSASSDDFFPIKDRHSLDMDECFWSVGRDRGCSPDPIETPCSNKKTHLLVPSPEPGLEDHNSPPEPPHHQTKHQISLPITSIFRNNLTSDPTLNTLPPATKAQIMSLLDEIDQFHNGPPSVPGFSTETSVSPCNTKTEKVQSEMATQTSADPWCIATQDSLHETASQTDSETSSTKQLNTDNSDQILIALGAIEARLAKLESLGCVKGAHEVISSNQINGVGFHLSPPEQQLILTPKSTICIKPSLAGQAHLSDLAGQIRTLDPPPGVQITKFRVNQNTIEIRTKNEVQKNQLKSFLNDKLISDTITDKKPVMQRIILFNVPDSTSQEVLKNAINTKINLDPSLDLDMHLTKTNKTRREGFENWIISIPKKFSQLLRRHTYIYLGYHKVYLRKYLRVIRCTNCQSLNSHTNALCEEKTYCSLCGGNHHYLSCQATNLHCINCATVNHSEQNTTNHLSTDHSAASSDCPSFRKQMFQLLQSCKQTRRTLN